jgi:hypothetical protein
MSITQGEVLAAYNGRLCTTEQALCSSHAGQATAGPDLSVPSGGAPGVTEDDPLPW